MHFLSLFSAAKVSFFSIIRVGEAFCLTLVSGKVPRLVLDKKGCRKNQGRPDQKGTVFCPTLSVLSPGGHCHPHFSTCAFFYRLIKDLLAMPFSVWARTM